MIHNAPRKRLNNEVDNDDTAVLAEDELSINTALPRPSPTVGSLLVE
jgi:hypothetical protein